MAKKTMLKLNRNARTMPGYADEIVQDYKKANDEWSRIFSEPESETVNGLTELINHNKKTFLEINSTGTWEDAMVWSAFLYYYDAQTGLTGEYGLRISRLIEAFQKSECSSYVKRTVDYTYYIIRDHKVERSYS